MFSDVWTSQVALVVKNLPANVGDTGDVGSIPGSRRSPEEGHGNPLQCSCLENPMDRGAWRAAVHGVTKSQTCPSPYKHTEHVDIPASPVVKTLCSHCMGPGFHLWWGNTIPEATGPGQKKKKEGMLSEHLSCEESWEGS